MLEIRGITMMANEAKRGNAHVMMPGISGLYIKKIASLSLRAVGTRVARVAAATPATPQGTVVEINRRGGQLGFFWRRGIQFLCHVLRPS